MATTTIYASGQSGRIRATGSTYLDAVRGDGTQVSNPTDALAYCGQRGTSPWYVYEAFLKWDTSAIGSDIVSNVDLDVDGDSDVSSTDPVLEGYEYDWGSTLENADYRDSDSGIPALGPIISSYDTAGGWDTGSGYNNDLGADADFIGAINGSGDTRIVILPDRTRTETEPTGNEYVTFECTGNTNDARLTIVHAAATGEHVPPDADLATGTWAVTPLWSKVDDDPASPDATVITDTTS